MRFFQSIIAIIFLTAFNVAADNESKFKVLFDGKNLEGWKHAGNWEIQDDGSVFRKDKGGSLAYVTESIPDDFELRFEWKVGKGSNSGLYYRPGQYEYQILDNKGHGNGTNPRTTAASLYFCMAPSKDVTNPVGEWNTGRIVGKGSLIQHWLNGEKVISFDYKDSQWKDQVELLRRRGGNLEARNARLSLQDHGNPVWFRNIRMRELTAEDKVDPTPVQPAEIPADIRAAEEKKLQGMEKKRADSKAKKKE